MQMAAISDNSPKVFHKWKPIEPIDSDSQAYDFREIDSLQRQWLNIKRQVESSTPDAYKAFTDRLTRRWSIETGIIEGIYELDRGVTETLVQQGIAADYIERSSTDKEPSELVRILKDHEESIEAVNFWIEQSRPLTKNFIKSLHTQILNSQRTHTAMNQFGDRFEATLRKGEFKLQPNNPTRPDGSVHEYCPPEQVESELDNLLVIYAEYVSENRHPLLLAAWLHHRFEQIHPFQDGNGRVGRAILTWHLVKNGFFPIVISRGDRTEYINSLESADTGDLTSLIALFVRLEKNTILQAISVVTTESQLETGPQGDSIDQLVSNIIMRAERRQVLEYEQMRAVNDTALALRRTGVEYLDMKCREVRNRLKIGGIYVDTRIEGKEADKSTEYRYRVQVLKTAEDAGHWVNDNEPRYLVKLSLDATDDKSRIPRLTFVISLHNIGRRLTGVMASTAFAQVEHYNGQDYIDPIHGIEDLDSLTFRNCTVNPFTFTWNDSTDVINDRFVKWSEECFGIALQFWGKILTHSAE